MVQKDDDSDNVGKMMVMLECSVISGEAGKIVEMGVKCCGKYGGGGADGDMIILTGMGIVVTERVLFMVNMVEVCHI